MSPNGWLQGCKLWAGQPYANHVNLEGMCHMLWKQWLHVIKYVTGSITAAIPILQYCLVPI